MQSVAFIEVMAMQITTGAISLPVPVDVLYIDDDVPVRQAACDMLREEGLSVGDAANGAEALAFIEGHKPSLVFVDLEMPVMNGREFIERIKKNPATAAIPVVVVSGFVQPCVMAGPDGVIVCLAKPISQERLIDYARRFVGRVRREGKE